MAKSKSFFGLRKGSTKTMTFSVLRGQQITKDRVTDIANPRTMDQTLQRIPFAQAVKFYKQATRGLFRFAYEDKRPLESDYNAFMRHNVKYASSVSKSAYSLVEVPSIGNWLLSEGSIAPAVVRIDGSNLELTIGTSLQAPTTIGQVSERILDTYEELVEGDIVTFVTFVSGYNPSSLAAPISIPEMQVKQFVINTNSTTLLSTTDFTIVGENNQYLTFDNLDDDFACAGAVIFSRNSPSGLKVSEAYIKGNEVWNTYMSGRLTPVVTEGDAYSWGAAEKAILQGSLSD